MRSPKRTIRHWSIIQIFGEFVPAEPFHDAGKHVNENRNADKIDARHPTEPRAEVFRLNRQSNNPIVPIDLKHWGQVCIVISEDGYQEQRIGE